MAEIRGNVHSIETLGALDGPGLRCVVFLQGCPLRCQYCHNPDTWEEGGGGTMSCDELLARIVRYQAYFGQQGGVTLSGGEPLQQSRFAARVLEACLALGIHTAIDTSGAVPPATVQEALAATRLVILDIKHTDAARYRALTGGSSLARPLAFLREIVRRGLPLWVRQVIVPGWNDNTDDIRALARLLRDIPSLQRVELLPYHRLGVEKWQRLGYRYPLAGVAPMEEGQLSELSDILHEELGMAGISAIPVIVTAVI